MNDKIKKHIIEYNKKNGWGIEEQDIIETILEATTTYEEVFNERRHWNDIFAVCKIGGMLIGYNSATTTGDMNAEEKGWEFDPDSICEVVAKEVTKTTYVAKEE